MCDPEKLFHQIDAKLFSFQMKTHLDPKVIYLGYRQWLELKMIVKNYGLKRVRTGKSKENNSGVEYSGIPVVKVIADNYLEVG